MRPCHLSREQANAFASTAAYGPDPTASDATQMVRLMKWLKALLWTTTRHAAWCAGIPTPNAALYSSFGGNGAEADGILFPTARRPLMCSARS